MPPQKSQIWDLIGSPVLELILLHPGGNVHTIGFRWYPHELWCASSKRQKQSPLSNVDTSPWCLGEQIWCGTSSTLIWTALGRMDTSYGHPHVPPWCENSDSLILNDLGKRDTSYEHPHVREILILMKVGISTSTWFQVVPIYSMISEHFLFSLPDDFLRRL